ncbi:MAG TPA: Mur ligase family protein, partial [Candidatus Saccharimonadia bacterium]
MRAAIIGYGVEGALALKYWHNLGYQVCVHDANRQLELPDVIESHLGPDYLKNLDQYDLIVRSPGVRPQLILQANPNLNATQITSVTTEFLAQCPAKVIGVTGTKGKGTTATLITKMLEAAGYTVHLGGNIGHPPLDFLDQVEPEDWVVLELSSFQLMDIKQSPQVAVMLMIATDHLNWHADLHEYLSAKQN